MKKINIKYWLICFILFSLGSCNNDDGETLFSNAPADRVSQANSELLNLLTSEANGYKGVYFTKNDEFGGFTYYMKFNTDGTVDMTSDFDSETAIETSSYEVRLGTTIELVFTTRNHIQKVSNPEFEIDGTIGAGFKGTSVFQYFGSDNGVMTFKDVRNKNTSELLLKPSQLANFNTESVQSVETSLSLRESVLPTTTSSLFQILKIQNGEKVTNFNLNYDLVRLYASPSILVEEDGVNSVKELGFGVAFNEDGLTISPSLEFEGQTYKDFVYDVDSNSYISNANGTTASILFDSNVPALIPNDIEEIKELTNNSISLIWWPENAGSNELTSKGFQAILDEVNQNCINDFGFSCNINYVQFVFDFDDDQSFCQGQLTLIDAEGFGYVYCFGPSTNIVDNKLFLEYQGPGNGNANFISTQAQSLIDFYASPSGIIVTTEGFYTATLNGEAINFGNLSATMTSIDNPSARIYGYICCAN